MADAIEAASMDYNEFRARIGEATPAKQPPQGESVDGKVNPYPFVSLDQVKPRLESRDIIRGLLPRAAFGEVHADRSGGKTAIIVDVSLHVADGRDYRGRRVEQQPVVYVALEGHGGIDNRVYAARKHLGIEQAPFYLVKISADFRKPEAAMRVAATAQAVTKAYPKACPLIVIDTYSAALGPGGTDTDQKDVSAFINNVQAHLLAAAYTVLVLHHFGRDKTRGGRGWTGLGAALDFEWEITREGARRTMTITKNRDGSDDQPSMCYQLRPYEIGVDPSTGDPVTSVVVDHLADAEPERKHDLTTKGRKALNVLWLCLKDRALSFPMADEPGLRCVIVSTWEAESCKLGAISASTRERDRQRQFKAAMDELITAKLVISDGQRAYPAPREDRE